MQAWGEVSWSGEGLKCAAPVRWWRPQDVAVRKVRETADRGAPPERGASQRSGERVARTRSGDPTTPSRRPRTGKDSVRRSAGM